MDKWEQGLDSFLSEVKEEERQQLITSAIIAGRLSLLYEMEKRFEQGIDFKLFIGAMQEIVLQEVKEGRVDKDTFSMPQELFE